MKNPDVRIQETIAFLRNAVVPVGQNWRDLVADLLEYKYQIDNPTSVAMSQGHNFAIIDRPGVKTLRQYRRACIAIRAAILGQAVALAAQAVSQILDANLPAALGADLNAAFHHEQTLAQNALQALLNNPGAFLTNNNLITREAGPSGQTNYIFYYNHSTSSYTLGPLGAAAGNIIALGGVNGNRAVYVPVQAFYVRVQNFNTLPANLAAIPGDQMVAGAASIMVTARFSGCSLMFRRQGVNLTAIHIEPAPANPVWAKHYDLVKSLRGQTPPKPAHIANAGFSNANNAGPLRVWGCAQNEAQPLDYEPSNYHYLIGVFHAGQWELWVQKQNAAQARVGSWRVD